MPSHFAVVEQEGYFMWLIFFYSQLSPEFGQQEHTFYFKSRAIAASLIIY